ncbi:MAG: hypothetical protein ACLP1X_29430 [Polyangiaceae bacterium]
MWFRGARFFAASCVVLSVACGLGTAGLSGPPISSANGIPDATTSDGMSSLDAQSAADGIDQPESVAGDSNDGASVEVDSADDALSPGDANGAGEGGTGNDGGAPVDAGGGHDGGSGSDASNPEDAGASCADASDCVVVPTGWTFVAFAPTQSAPCPTGFGQSADFVEGPDTTNACGCAACTTTTQPSCAAGPLQVLYDEITNVSAGTCNLPGSVTPLGNSPAGTCLTDLYQGDYALYDLEYVPSGPSGGVCSSPGATSLNDVTYAAHDRTCTPASPQSAGCSGNVCTPIAGGPYAGCIAAPGAVTCPAGPLSVQHLVGTDVSFDCSSCTCTVTGTCTGTVTLYSDEGCTRGALDVPADGTCYEVLDLVTKPATSYNSYIYTGNSPSDIACEASGASSAQDVALANETTICCAP